MPEPGAPRCLLTPSSTQRDAPAFHVPEYLVSVGVDVVPVPVYYPEVTTILERPVYRSVAAIPSPPPIDIVCVVRRPQDIPAHVADLLAAKPHAVWFQLGIRDDASAEILARAGIVVVQDACLLVEHAAASRAQRQSRI